MYHMSVVSTKRIKSSDAYASLNAGPRTLFNASEPEPVAQIARGLVNPVPYLFQAVIQKVPALEYSHKCQSVLNNEYILRRDSQR